MAHTIENTPVQHVRRGTKIELALSTPMLLILNCLIRTVISLGLLQ